jgi:hypothetical protein
MGLARDELARSAMKKYSDPRTLTFCDGQYRYEVKQLNKEVGNGRK